MFKQLYNRREIGSGHPLQELKYYRLQQRRYTNVHTYFMHALTVSGYGIGVHNFQYQFPSGNTNVQMKSWGT